MNPLRFRPEFVLFNFSPSHLCPLNRSHFKVCLCLKICWILFFTTRTNFFIVNMFLVVYIMEISELIYIWELSIFFPSLVLFNLIGRVWIFLYFNNFWLKYWYLLHRFFIFKYMVPAFISVFFFFFFSLRLWYENEEFVGNQ